jgi:tetratricopeptide (TPR) repeat protein
MTNENWIEFRADGTIGNTSEDSSVISPTFQQRLQQAAALENQGAYEQALSAYQQILAPFDNSIEPRELTLDFLGHIELRKIYCLLVLQRYEAAKALCENQTLKAYLDQLTLNDLYSYYFFYATSLGHLGQIREMDQQISLAMQIAAEPLGDLEKYERAWQRLLLLGKVNQAWEYLLEQSKAAHQAGVKNGSIFLQVIAGEYGFFALRGLDRKAEAKRGAEKILQRYQSAEIPEKISEWEHLLQTVQ